MKKFKVGIQLYGVRNSLKEDFEGTLKAIKDMGYEYVEFAGNRYNGKSADEVKAILDELGLKCISAHQGLNFSEEQPEECIKFFKTLGVKYYIIPWYEKTWLAGNPEWENTVKRFRKAADFLSENGLMLGYHNHDFEFEMVDGKYVYDYIFEAIDPDKIVPEIDTCWVCYSGLDPAAKIREFAGRVEVVHLKDFYANQLKAGPAYALIDANGNPIKPKDENSGFRFRPLGQGMQDFGKILEACEESGTEVVIVEQDETYDMPELEAARISREFLRDKFGL